MKNILYITFFSFFHFSFNLSAQITLTVEDVPQVGDELLYLTDTTVQDRAPGPPGINQNWDFTSLMAEDTFSFKVVAPSVGPDADLFPDANIAIEVDSIFLYANLSDTALLNYGTAIDLLGTGTPFQVRFEPFQKLFEFPTTAGTNFEQRYRLMLDVDGSFIGFDSVRFTRQTFERTAVDASGTLRTPANTYQALRVRTLAVSTDSIFLQQLGVWIPVSVSQSTSEQYNWIVEGGPGIVMTMFVDSLGRAESIDWLDSFTPAGTVTAPMASFEVEDQGEGVFAFTDQSSNDPDSWLWDFGDGNTSSAQNPTHTYLQSGTYDVCLTVSNSAGSNTSCQMVNAVVTSLDLLQRKFGFRIFPNPVGDQMRLQFDNSEGASPVIVFSSLSGQVFFREVLANRLKINTDAWPPGTYVFSVFSQEGTWLGSGKVQVVR